MEIVRILLVCFLFSLCFLCTAQKQQGKASFYSDKFKGRSTASGEKYDPMQLTAAHKKLPFGTCVLVTNLVNDSSIVLRINDRGPFVKGRIIDVSRAAAKKLGFYLNGITKVSVQIVDSVFTKTSQNSTQ